MTTVSTAPATTRVPASRRIGHDLTSASSLNDALQLADLDWGLEIHPAETLSLLTPDGFVSTSIPGKRLVMRDDTHVTLGVVGGAYQPVDNRATFSLADAVVAAGGAYLAGGYYGGGRRTFMELSIPEADVNVGGLDLVRASVLILAGHDGESNVVATNRLTRMVCTNGMHVTVKGIPATVSVRHTLTAHDRIAAADELMRALVRYGKSFGAVAQELIDTPMTRNQFGVYIDGLFPRPEDDGSKRSLGLWETRREELLKLWEFAETNALGRNTRWGAFNSVTEYLDWGSVVRTREGVSVEEQRALRQMQDAGRGLRDRALASLTS